NKINSATQNYSYFLNGTSQNSQKLQSDSVYSYTYDNNGNTLTKNGPEGTYNHTWSKDNQLTNISGPNVTGTNSYDYKGRRSSKNSGSGATTMIYEDQNMVAERGTLSADFLFGPGIDEPLAMVRNTTHYFFVADALGSVGLTNDSSGTVQNSYVFDGWGVTRSQTAPVSNPFAYTAREAGEASLMYYRARYYAPGIGRFVSEDPLTATPFFETENGSNVQVSEGDSLNDYFYVYNQPTRYIDPTGLIGLRIGPYCGLKQNSNWPDVSENSIDFCCKRHDLCYRSNDIGSSGGASDPEKQCAVYNCDISICRCAVRNYHGSVREKALIKMIKIRFKCKDREGHPPEGCCTAY
ncbi:hypothetical protein L0244_38990, partial [bacterium]|nr:hypothetical protein [bacterium]